MIHQIFSSRSSIKYCKKKNYGIIKENIVEKIRLCKHCIEKTDLLTCPPIASILAESLGRET